MVALTPWSEFQRGCLILLTLFLLVMLMMMMVMMMVMMMMITVILLLRIIIDINIIIIMILSLSLLSLLSLSSLLSLLAFLLSLSRQPQKDRRVGKVEILIEKSSHCAGNGFLFFGCFPFLVCFITGFIFLLPRRITLPSPSPNVHILC